MLAMTAIFVIWQPYLFRIYVKHVYSAPCNMVNANDFNMWHIYVYMSSIYVYLIFAINAQFGWHICFWYIFDGNL